MMDVFTHTAFWVFAAPLGFVLIISCLGAILTKATGKRWL